MWILKLPSFSTHVGQEEKQDHDHQQAALQDRPVHARQRSLDEVGLAKQCRVEVDPLGQGRMQGIELLLDRPGHFERVRLELLINGHQHGRGAKDARVAELRLRADRHVGQFRQRDRQALAHGDHGSAQLLGRFQARVGPHGDPLVGGVEEAGPHDPRGLAHRLDHLPQPEDQGLAGPRIDHPPGLDLDALLNSPLLAPSAPQGIAQRSQGRRKE